MTLKRFIIGLAALSALSPLAASAALYQTVASEDTATRWCKADTAWPVMMNSSTDLLAKHDFCSNYPFSK
jgi:hypothetical protein